MRKYSQYKQTEVKGIASIPKDWVINKIKFISKTIAGGTPDTTNLQFWENGTIPWLPSGKVHDCNIYEEDADTFITELGLKGSAAKLIPTNSILIALTGATCANIAHLHFSATANQSVVAMPGSKKIVNRFLFYCLLGIREQILINKTGGAQSGINDGDIKNTQIPFPSLPEQVAIVRFLDYKTGQIDSFIANRQKQIELLKEQKAGIINKAVTKGINPNAKMKDSGIEWIGDVPENWEVSPFKRNFTLAKGLTITKDDLTEFGVAVINYGQIHSKLNTGLGIDDTLIKFISNEYLSTEKKSLVKNGEFIFADTSEDIEGCGNCAFVDKDIKVFAGYHSIIGRTKNHSYAKFFSYLFKTDSWRSQIRSQVYGVKVFSITNKILKETLVIIPPIEDQNKITAYLDNSRLEIDTLISKYKKQTDLMQEYRTSLISQVVTGKIDVREWEPKKKNEIQKAQLG